MNKKTYKEIIVLIRSCRNGYNNKFTTDLERKRIIDYVWTLVSEDKYDRKSAIKDIREGRVP